MDQTPTRTGRLPILVLLALALAAGPLLLAACPARAATTFVVNRLGDQPDLKLDDDRCDVDVADGDQCTLRAGIQQANATSGADTIHFNVPGGGLQSIRPRTPLPNVTQRLTIDGYTQPGASLNTAMTGTNAVLRVELDGSLADAAVGLVILAADSVVRGLVINRFGSDGIEVRGAAATSVRISGCFIGTDAAGSAALANLDDGLDIRDSPNAVIGGSAPAARNLVAGNASDGVRLRGATGARVLGNLIGTTHTGTVPLGNDGAGVFSSASGAFVGGDGPGEANVVAFNGAAGVAVQSPGTGNRILRNAIFANAGLGIDLGNDGETQNDPGDFDGGANSLQNAPAVTAAKSGRVRGTLHSTPNATFAIRVFSSPSGDEGKVFRGGPVQVTTDASGNAAFVIPTTSPILIGHRVTATATGTSGTSEFSAAFTAP